uniref:Uncharacterized protein n=1 Tax=Cacopsylla melanoneura TaxID=428564 RepID=A0A8D9B2K3_9HEMI
MIPTPTLKKTPEMNFPTLKTTPTQKKTSWKRKMTSLQLQPPSLKLSIHVRRTVFPTVLSEHLMDTEVSINTAILHWLTQRMPLRMGSGLTERDDSIMIEEDNETCTPVLPPPTDPLAQTHLIDLFLV